MTSFIATFYLATDLAEVSAELDAEDGILAVKKVPIASIPERVLSGEIVCSQSIAAFLTASAYLNKQSA